MTVEERKLINKLYYVKGISVPKIKQIECFRYYSISSLYKVIHGNRITIKSEKMQHVVKLKNQGYSNVRIAEMLNISRRTVYNYVRISELNGKIFY
jgi:transposase